MSIDEMVGLLPPPSTPSKTGSRSEWSLVEKKLGIKLPMDYKQFVSKYGTGGIDEFLWILTPFVKDENVNLFKKMEIIFSSYLESKKQFPDLFKHSVFPERRGILPWAITDNGDVLYWKMESDPEHWRVVVYDGRSPDFIEFKSGMTEFLIGLIKRGTTCNIFPDDFPAKPPKFISVDVV